MAKAKLQRNPIAEEMQSNSTVSNNQDVIAQRAYALYLARGREDGHDLEDWLRAEQELRGTNSAEPRKSVVEGGKLHAKS